MVLVDTPGFDDTKWTKGKFLKLIGDWLKKTYVELNTCGSYSSQQLCLCRYKEGILLSAIVYVHDITWQSRMSATPYRTLLMFGELTGCKGPLSNKRTVNTVFLTTMWDVVENK